MDTATIEFKLRELTRRVPFRPFTVHLKNEQCFEVDIPNNFAMRDGTFAFVTADIVPWFFRHDELVSINAEE